MSKTLTSVLTIGAAIAINVIPGIGQAISGAIVGALGGTFTAASIAFTAVDALTLGLTVAGIGALESLLAKHPKPEQTETAIRNPIPPRVSGYGTNRYFMAYALYATASDGTAIDVGVFHDGKASAIRARYLGDVRINISGTAVSKTSDGQFGDGKVHINTRLGLATETAFSEVIAKLPDQWTSAHRGDGCVTGCVLSSPVKSKNYQEVYPTGGPNSMPLSLVLDAQPVFDWRDGTQSAVDPSTWKFSENAILHLAHYELVRDNKDWETHFAPTLDYWTAAANDADVAMPLKGVQTIILEKANDGSEHLTLASVNGLATGMTIVISATGDTSLTETRTVTSISGTVVGLSSALDNDHPQGSQVTWSSSSGSPATEPRYRSCLAHKHIDPHKSVVSGLLGCCDGWMAPRADGALVVYSGRYYAPTVTIGPDEIIGYSIQDGIDEEDALNQLAVTYISANHDYTTVDTDSWEDDDDIAARGKVLNDSIANQVPSHSQARRLAKRKMAQIMASKRGTFTTNAAGRAAMAERYIHLQVIEAGTTFLDGPVEITKITRNLATGGITAEWIVADPNIDAWNPATEEGNPAPVGNRVAPQPLAPPTITSAVANFGADSASGTTGVFLDLIVSSDVGDRTDVTWYARTKEHDATIWGERTYTDIDPGATVEIATEFVPTDTHVDVQVSYELGDGRQSDWSETVTVDTSTAAIAPAAPTELTVTANETAGEDIGWRNPTSSNFSYSRVFSNSTNDFSGATQVGSDTIGGLGQVQSITDTAGDSSTYYWVAAYSATNAASTPVGPSQEA